MEYRPIGISFIALGPRFYSAFISNSKSYLVQKL
jgi:hypothetical protein